MQHMTLPSHVDTTDPDDVMSFMRSVSRGKTHVSVWANGMQAMATRCIVSGAIESSVMLSSSGVTNLRVGNVWLRDADLYGIQSEDMLRLASLLGEDNLKSTPGGTAASIVQRVCGFVDNSAVMSDEVYDAVRSGVPHGWMYQAQGTSFVADDASVEARYKAFAHCKGAVSIGQNRIHEIDVNGAYRWAMRQALPMPRFGLETGPADISVDGAMTRCDVSRDVLGIVGHRLSGAFSGWASNRLLRIAIDNGASVRLHETMRAKVCKPWLARFVITIERLMLKDPAMRSPLKLICNNAFGRMFRVRESKYIVRTGTEHGFKRAIGVSWEGRRHCLIHCEASQDPLSNPIAASEIASIVTERIIGEAVRLVKSGARHIYTDTDSITYAGMTPSDAGVDVSDKGGAFKEEYTGAHSVWVPKAKQRFAFDANGKCVKAVAAGVHKECIPQLIESTRAEIERAPSVLECVLLGRELAESVCYTYTLRQDGIGVEINGRGLDGGWRRAGRNAAPW